MSKISEKIIWYRTKRLAAAHPFFHRKNGLLSMREANVSNSVFAYIVPFQTYDTTSGMEANRYFWQIATVFAAALIINAIVIRKNGWKEV